MLRLEITKRTDERLLSRMKIHYSQPKGFVGRNICYAVYFNDDYFGHIVGGSATMHLPGRHEFLGTTKSDLNSIVNNIFFNVSVNEKYEKYPIRNFTSAVLKEFRCRIQEDWYNKYGDTVIGFETLIEAPRTGDLYIKDGWSVVGETKGFTCKRVGGVSTDGWSGVRVWNKDPKNLRPKIVLARKL